MWVVERMMRGGRLCQIFGEKSKKKKTKQYLTYFVIPIIVGASINYINIYIGFRNVNQ